MPYIWAVDKKNQLNRVLVAKPIIEACEDRRNFWRVLKALAGVDAKPEKVDREALTREIQAEITQKIAGGLMQLINGGISPASKEAHLSTSPSPAKHDGAAVVSSKLVENYKPPALESASCTSCGECVAINPTVFAYNSEGKAYIKDPTAGPYKDLVKAAEKCPAGVIRPGLPADPSGDAAKWVQRAARFNA